MNQPSTESFASFDTAFQSGIQNYQAKNFEPAKLAFTKALEFEPDNPSALTNLALVQYQLGEKGWALALLRKAKTIDPNLPTTKSALNFISTQMEVKEIPHEVKPWETLRNKAIEPFSLSFFIILTAGFLLSAGWTLLKYLGSRRRAFENNTALPSWPIPGLSLFLVFILSFLLMSLKFFDTQIPRATVVLTKVSALSQPDEKAPILFDLYSGLEIIINQTQNEWAQVTYPGGPTGWVQKSAISATTPGK